VTLSATVLVPTHVHGPTLYHSVGSALAQTVSDIEVLIVGDGVDTTTREVAADLEHRDPRVRYLDFPKGPRLGEVNRHAALEHARGRIVCYLSDDDLWFPNHLAVMDALLQGDVGFAHALPIVIDPEGRFTVKPVDVTLPYYRGGILAGRNWIPLSCAGHTLDVYRRLPVGWSTTPARILGADLHMWQKLLRSEGRGVSGSRPTVLVFPSPDRPGWLAQRRADELAEWGTRVADPEWRATFVEGVLDYAVRDWARLRTLTPRGRILGLLVRLGLFVPIFRFRKAARAVFARVGH
jgi:glycosyltransferase involved in cell wall biosynthesis